MLFVYSAIDRHDKSELRAKNNAAHVKYVYEYGLKVVHAGPLVCDDGVSPIGTLIIVDALNREAVQEFIDNDPYVIAGLFNQISLIAWDKKTS
ncbi:MAG: YciI family protein [Alphaproteobacteria bacterium]|nr:YciI family protein [Alphaproteobacteria bacterium]